SAKMLRCASFTSIANESANKKRPRRMPWPLCRSTNRLRLCRWQLCGLYGDEAAALALVLELDLAGDLGKERVVAAAAHIQAGLDARAALPHDDGAARHHLAGE